MIEYSVHDSDSCILANGKHDAEVIRYIRKAIRETGRATVFVMNSATIGKAVFRMEKFSFDSYHQLMEDARRRTVTHNT